MPSDILAFPMDRGARAVGMSGAESDYYERNARNILTTWGDRDQSLNDYANRTWAGLVATYYKPRWELFCDAVLEAVESDEPFDEAAFTERCKDSNGHGSIPRIKTA